MQNGPKTVRQFRPQTSSGARPINRRTSLTAGPAPRGYQNAQRNYERYLELARAETLAGNPVGAENYYQHAEHYFRTMSSEILVLDHKDRYRRETVRL